MTAAHASTSLTPEDDDRVRGTAHKLARELGLSHAVDDLIGYGYQGLVEARHAYDPTRGVPFGPFSYYRIRGAMIDGAQKVAGFSRRTYARLLAAANHALEDAADVRAHAGEAPDTEEVGRSVDDALGNLVSAFLLTEQAEADKSPEHQLDDEMQRRRVRRAVADLPDQERLVLEALYFDERRLEDVGRDLGLSAPTACRLHARALALLRARLRSASG